MDWRVLLGGWGGLGGLRLSQNEANRPKQFVSSLCPRIPVSEFCVHVTLPPIVNMEPELRDPVPLQGTWFKPGPPKGQVPCLLVGSLLEVKMTINVSGFATPSGLLVPLRPLLEVHNKCILGVTVSEATFRNVQAQLQHSGLGSWKPS